MLRAAGDVPETYADVSDRCAIRVSGQRRRLRAGITISLLVSRAL